MGFGARDSNLRINHISAEHPETVKQHPKIYVQKTTSLFILQSSSLLLLQLMENILHYRQKKYNHNSRTSGYMHKVIQNCQVHLLA